MSLTPEPQILTGDEEVKYRAMIPAAIAAGNLHYVAHYGNNQPDVNWRCRLFGHKWVIKKNRHHRKTSVYAYCLRSYSKYDKDSGDAYVDLAELPAEPMPEHPCMFPGCGRPSITWLDGFWIDGVGEIRVPFFKCDTHEDSRLPEEFVRRWVPR